MTITELKSRIFLPNLSTTSVETYVATTDITPKITVDVFGSIELPTSCNAPNEQLSTRIIR